MVWGQEVVVANWAISMPDVSINDDVLSRYVQYIEELASATDEPKTELKSPDGCQNEIMVVTEGEGSNEKSGNPDTRDLG